MSNLKTKKSIFTILRYIITFILLYLIFRKIDIKTTLEVFKKLNIFYLILAILASLLTHLITTSRWQFALKQNDVNIKYPKLLQVHFISIFLQNFLPTSVGGDFIKGILSFKGNPKIRVASSIIISRISGILILIIMANISLYSFKVENEALYKFRWIASGVLLGFIIALILIFNKKTQTWLINKYNSIKIKKLKKFEFNVFFEKINTYKRINKASIFLLFSIIIQFLVIVTSYCLFLSAGESINIIYFFLYVPIIVLIIILPVSLNGLGVREGLYYYFFNPIISQKASIFSFILLILLIRLIFSLVGSILFLFKKHETS